MRKILLIGTLVLIVTSMLMGVVGFAQTTKGKSSEQNSLQIKIVDKTLFQNPRLYVIDNKYVDVTGDKVKDIIILVGAKELKEQWFKEISIVIKNGITQKYKVISNICSGYDSSNLFIGDFNKDNVSDIMVSISNGRRGGTCSYGIWSYKNSILSIISSIEELSKGAQFEGKFMNNYKVEIRNIDTNKTTIIDISCKKNFYNGLELYDENEKLLVDRTVSFDGYTSLHPIDYDEDNTYELQGTQRILGVHAETISNVYTLWKFKDSKFKLKYLELSTIMLHYYQNYEQS